jgi:hypothetical protein
MTQPGSGLAIDVGCWQVAIRQKARRTAVHANPAYPSSNLDKVARAPRDAKRPGIVQPSGKATGFQSPARRSGI